ncbi:MAG TPA: NAD(P)H-dependent oxidoreductase [Rhizomicrobium sp.]|nr:NAD(P)H-dependent oxidoreductase [Rhizomicrobium sp.]
MGGSIGESAWRGLDLAQGGGEGSALASRQENAVKHAIIITHPKARSFTVSVADAYAKACEALGHGTVIRDLYRIGFDPCLKPGEMPFAGSFQPEPDVIAERTLLKDCDVFAFFYPLWLNTPPAIAKGYLERVFGFGFAYGGDGHSYNPLLTGRKLINFSSSGAPTAWIKQTGALSAIQTLFDSYFAELCGLTALQHVHFGSITPGASEFYIQTKLNEVANTINQHFGRQT